MPAPTLPPVTDAHRRAAHQALAMVGWSFDAAMSDPLMRGLVEGYARTLRTREWQATHARTTTTVRRHNPATGRWHSERVPGDFDDIQASIGAD